MAKNARKKANQLSCEQAKKELKELEDGKHTLSKRYVQLRKLHPALTT